MKVEEFRKKHAAKLKEDSLQDYSEYILSCIDQLGAPSEGLDLIISPSWDSKIDQIVNYFNLLKVGQVKYIGDGVLSWAPTKELLGIRETLR